MPSTKALLPASQVYHSALQMKKPQTSHNHSNNEGWNNGNTRVPVDLWVQEFKGCKFTCRVEAFPSFVEEICRSEEKHPVSPVKLGHLHLNFPEWQKHFYDHKNRSNLTELYSFILLSSADEYREFLWFCRIGGHSYPSCELHIPPHQRGIKWCHLLPRSRNVFSHLLSESNLYFFPHLLSHRWKSRCQLPLSLLMTLPWLPSIGDKISPTSCHLPSASHFGISHLRTTQSHPLLQYWTRYIGTPFIRIRVSFTDCNALKKQHDYNKVRDVKPSTCSDSKYSQSLHRPAHHGLYCYAKFRAGSHVYRPKTGEHKSLVPVPPSLTAPRYTFSLFSPTCSELYVYDWISVFYFLFLYSHAKFTDQRIHIFLAW